jgi:hypothetical protein
VEWLQGGSVLMGVGMASIFATGKPALSVSSTFISMRIRVVVGKFIVFRF